MRGTSHHIVLVTALLVVGCRGQRDAGAGRMDAGVVTSAREVETKLADRAVITFPTQPQVENEASEAGIGRHSAMAWDEQRYYSATVTRRDVYSKLASSLVMSVLDAAVTAKVAAYARNEGGTELSRRPVTVGAISGIEFAVRVTKPKAGTKRTRVLISEGRYYDLMVFLQDADDVGGALERDCTRGRVGPATSSDVPMASPASAQRRKRGWVRADEGLAPRCLASCRLDRSG